LDTNRLFADLRQSSAGHSFKTNVIINNLQMSSSLWSILLLFFAFCNGLATGRVGVTTRIVGGTEVETDKYPYFGKGHAEMEGQ
jgi:hypothetical protein